MALLRAGSSVLATAALPDRDPARLIVCNLHLVADVHAILVAMPDGTSVMGRMPGRSMRASTCG